MKLAFINYFQSNIRGLETYISELANRFPESRIFSHSNPRSQNRSKLNLLKRFYLDPVSLSVGLWTVSKLPQLRKFDPDIVIAQNGGWSTLLLRLWTLMHQKKLVISGQSGPGWDDRNNLLFAPDIFVCLTQSQLAWAKKAFHWPWQRFAVIPNGVDLVRFSPKGHKAKINLKKPIILTVAALEPNKRVEETIKAVSKLKNASLLVIGKGPDQEKIKSLGQELLGERFLNLSVPHSQIPAYYRAADLFTLVSQKSEAFGIVYLEALSAGLPVVATADSSRREIIGQSGLFVKDPINPQDYAKILKKTLSKKWGDRPRLQATLFSWDNVVSSYKNLFKNL